MAELRTLQIQAPHFTAAIVLDQYGRVSVAAPILAYMRRGYWSELRVRNYCDMKNWIVVDVTHG